MNNLFDLPPKFLEKVDIIIISNLSNENFSVEILCKELTRSYSTTFRKIKTSTGFTPSMYIRYKRLVYAQFLLTKTELSISEVAFRCGFRTPNYFSKCFSKEYNITPLKYRKETEYDNINEVFLPI